MTAKQPFPFAKAFQLDPGLANALMGVINEVNGTGTEAEGERGQRRRGDADDDAEKN